MVDVTRSGPGRAGGRPEAEAGRPPLLVAGAAVAALALGQAIQLDNGAYSPLALGLVTVAIAALLVGLGAPRRAVAARVLVAVMAAGAVVQLVELVSGPPVLYSIADGAALRGGLRLAVLAGAVAAATACLGSRAHQRLGQIGLVLAFVVAGAITLRLSPDPAIDVVVVYRDSIAAQVDGTNPYTLTFPNIYGHTEFFSPGLATDERLLFGFQYPPLALLWAAPAELLLGDFRYAHVVALALAGTLIMAMRPGPVPVLAAALVLFNPRAFFVVEQGWTEPLLVMLAAGVAWAAVRRPAVLPFAAGALVVSKQYGIVMAPLLGLVADRSSRRAVLRQVAIAGGVAAAFTLPWLLADPDAFLYALVTVQNRLPFRTDGLTYLVAWFRATGAVLPTALGLALAVAAVGLAAWRAPRTPLGWSAATALTLTLLFAFNRQAFANYYFFILAVLWVGVACPWSRQRELQPLRSEAPIG